MQSSYSSRDQKPDASCARYHLLLTAVFDQQATPVEVRQAQAHLRECSSCALLWSDWRSMRRVFGAMEPALPDSGLLQRILIACRLHLLRTGAAVHPRLAEPVFQPIALPTHLHDDILRRTTGGTSRSTRRALLIGKCTSFAAVPALAAWLMLQSHGLHKNDPFTGLMTTSSTMMMDVPALPTPPPVVPVAVAAPAPAPVGVAPVVTASAPAPVVAPAIQAVRYEQPEGADDSTPRRAAAGRPGARPAPAVVHIAPPTPAAGPAVMASLPRPAAKLSSRRVGRAHFADQSIPTLKTVRSLTFAATTVSSSPPLETVAGEVGSIRDSRPEDVREVVDDFRASVAAMDVSDNSDS